MTFFKKINIKFLLILFISITNIIFSQTDNCGVSATLLTPGSTCTYTSGNTSGFTASGQGCTNGNADDDGWFRFVATATTHTITVDGSATFDAVLGVYNTCGGTQPTGGACIDLTGDDGIESRSLSGLTISNTYYIKVHDYGTGGGTFNICITAPPLPPSNDDCSNATALPCGTSNLAGTTVASVSETIPGCASAYGVWYTFTGNGQSTTINSTSESSFDHEIDIFSGSCGSLTNIACVDIPAGGGTETYSFTTVNGTSYYVYVAYYTTGTTTGSFTISRSCTVPPANDNCSGAIGLTVNSGTTCSTTTSTTSANATQSQAGCSGTADDDVWFSFVAGATTQSVSVTPGTMSDVVFEVFSGACAGLTTFSCVNSTTGSSVESSVISGLTVSSTYFVRVYSAASGSGAGTFAICVTTPPTPPSNDNCSGATSLPCGTSNLAGTTVGAVSETAPGGCASAYGVWYTFPGDGQVTTISSTAAASFDHEIDIFSGSCSSLTNIACVDGPGAGGTETYSFTSIVGTTYYVYIAYYTTGTTTGSFTVSRSCIPIPSNDNCSGATSLPCGTSNLAGTTVGAASETAPGGCASAYGVWYTFPGDGQITTINCTAASGFDHEIDIFSGSCGSLTNIACVDGASTGGTESYTLTSVVGTTYYVYVAYYTTGTTTGSFTISRACIPPPANDNCSGSFSVTVNPTTSCATSFTATTFGATQSQAGCTANADDDVWFSFTAISTSQIITVTQITMDDAVFQVFSGSCGSLGNLVCVDAGAGVESTTLAGLTVGTTYYIRVYSYGNSSAAGTFSICITTPYDPCSSITNIASCGSTINATIASGTGAYSSSSCGFTTPGKELIYTFTPATSGVYNIQQFSSYEYIDYQYKIASAGCSSSGWTCFDDLSGAATSANVASLVAGVQYYILLDPEVTGGGNISFTIKCPPTPPGNDDCPSATPAAVSSGSTCTSLTNGTLYGSTASSQANGCNAGNDDHDVWYSFVATSSSHSITINNVAGSPTDLYHSVYAGSCGSPGPAIVCSDPNNSTVNGLILGNTYYIRIYTYSSSSNPTTTFSVCIKTGPTIGACGNPVTNDYCSNPATLTQGAGTFSSSTSSIYSSDQAGNLSGIFCGSIENNSWYQFVATGSTATFPFTSITGCTWGDGVQAHVYNVTHNASGCCTAFNSVSNCYNPGTTSTGTVTATGLTAGQTYVLMVDGYAGDVCNFTVSGWTAVGILPMELLTFVGRNEDEKNKLQWVTATEKNTKLFTVEKSKDGVTFESLMDVDAAGYSTSPKNYNAFDLEPFKEITYYRLKLVNTNNSFEYSNIIAVDNKNLTDYISNARPNPTNGELEFDINTNSKEKILIEIYSNTGSLISSEEKIMDGGYRSLNLDINKYDSGIYLLKVSFENSGKTEIQKIIKH